MRVATARDAVMFRLYKRVQSARRRPVSGLEQAIVPDSFRLSGRAQTAATAAHVKVEAISTILERNMQAAGERRRPIDRASAA